MTAIDNGNDNDSVSSVAGPDEVGSDDEEDVRAWQQQGR